MYLCASEDRKNVRNKPISTSLTGRWQARPSYSLMQTNQVIDVLPEPKPAQRLRGVAPWALKQICQYSNIHRSKGPTGITGLFPSFLHFLS